MAGATASAWAIVVNGDSPDSRTVANHYAHLRDVPARNVIVLRDVPAGESIDWQVFRDRILKPVLEQLSERKLDKHVQGVAYSCDFPTQITFPPPDAPQNMQHLLAPVASINSATYLYQFVLQRQASPVGLFNNYYSRLPVADTFRFAIPKDLLIDDSGSADSAADSAAAGADQSQPAAELQTAAQLQGKADLLRRYAERFPFQANAWFLLAVSQARAGERDAAVDSLERAVEAGFDYGKMLRQEGSFGPLIVDSRFRALQLAIGESPTDFTEPRGFDARKYYTPNGVETAEPTAGVRYLLSVNLAATQQFGNTLEQAVECLRRSASADYSRPQGTFYFASTPDVRTTCRAPLFPAAIERLKALGFEAKEVATSYPLRADDCIGVMMGTADFDWDTTESTILPGAIAENLTSLGGVLNVAGQTKLTEYLEHGAAGSSGTVTEPYSLQQKFPLPLIHESYARGLTLAEAFYGNVVAPYQLLIVGDPLCAPWADPPDFEVTGLGAGAVVDRTIEIAVGPAAGVDLESDSPLTYQLIVDGELRAVGRGRFGMKVQAEPSRRGAVNLRFVAEEVGPLRVRREQSFWLRFAAAEPLEIRGPVRHPALQPLVVRLSRACDEEVSILHDWEKISSIPPGELTASIDPAILGRGPVRLSAAIDPDAANRQSSMPIVVVVE